MARLQQSQEPGLVEDYCRLPLAQKRSAMLELYSIVFVLHRPGSKKDGRVLLHSFPSFPHCRQLRGLMMSFKILVPKPISTYGFIFGRKKDMRIPVQYYDESFDSVDPYRLDTLIKSRAIIGFKRADGWVRVPHGPLRGHGGKTHKGPERRKS